MSFIDQLINAGFAPPELSKFENYSRSAGWLGATAYHPDIVFLNGNKEVIISLNGILGVYYLTPEELTGKRDFLDKHALRIIILKTGDRVFWKTLHGEIPGEQILKEFLSA